MSFPPVFTNILYWNAFKKIRKIIKNNKYKQNFKFATVYNTVDKTNTTNFNFRKSYKNTFTNAEIMNIVSNKLNTIFNNYNLDFQVIDHQDIIRYNKYHFFKFHRDFKKYYEDNCEIYTMIIGLKRCNRGGRTIVKFDGKTKYFKQSTYPRQFVMFKSELVHAGEKVLDYSKEILVLTVKARIKNIFHQSTTPQLQEFINRKFIISHSFKQLPTVVRNIIMSFLDCCNVFVEDELSLASHNIANSKYCIPIQISIHHKDVTYQNHEVTAINIFINNGIPYKKAEYFGNKFRRFNKDLDIQQSSNYEQESLYKNIDDFVHAKSFTYADYTPKSCIKFKTKELPPNFDIIFDNWFHKWRQNPPLHFVFHDEYSDSYEEYVLCNGEDDGYYEYNEIYTRYGICFQYGFIII